MRAADLLRKYRQSINPPYASKDFLVIGATILILLVVPLTVLLASQSRGLGPKAKEPLLVSALKPGFINLTYEYDISKNKLILRKKSFADLPKPPSRSANPVKVKAKVIGPNKKEVFNQEFVSTTASTDKFIFEIQVPYEKGSRLEIENHKKQLLEQTSL